jgi:hypothetical protein
LGGIDVMKSCRVRCSIRILRPGGGFFSKLLVVGVRFAGI